MADAGSEVAEMTSRLAIEYTGKAIEKTAEATLAALKLLLMKIEKDKLELKAGKTNLEALVKSGSQLSEVKVNENTKNEVMQLAKSSKVSIASIKTPQNEYKLVFRNEDQERVKNLFEELISNRTKNNITAEQKNSAVDSTRKETVAKSLSERAAEAKLKVITINEKSDNTIVAKIVDKAKEKGVKVEIAKSDENKQKIYFREDDLEKMKNILKDIVEERKVSPKVDLEKRIDRAIKDVAKIPFTNVKDKGIERQ